MRNKTFYLFFILSFVFCFAVGAVAEMGSANYRIPTSVMSGGGAPMTSDSYQTDSTLGQPSPLMDPANPPGSTNYDLYPGFWHTVELGLVVDPCEGDFDDDGDVDGSDLAVFAADFGRTDCCEPGAEPCEGDFDSDCDVDGSDLAVFAADFGRTDCP